MGSKKDSGTTPEIARPAFRLTRQQLDELPEYSTSIPTGTTIGKRWKRDSNLHDRMRVFFGSVAHLDFWSGARVSMAESLIPIPPEVAALAEPKWLLGEYADINDPKNVGIRWTPIEVIP